MNAKGILMHIDRADQIAVAFEAADAAHPVSAPGFLFMPAAGTPARCSSFRAGQARDAGLFGFVGQIIDVASVLPQRHALIVMASFVFTSYAVRIADEERSHLALHTEVDDCPGGLMAQVAYAPLRSPAHLVFRLLEFPPTAGTLGAAALLLR